MMQYSCPVCLSGLSVHDYGCEWSDVTMSTIEKAYIDILAILTRAPQTRLDLVKNVHGDWSKIHSRVFDRFDRERRIVSIGEVEQEGTEQLVYKLRTPDEIRADKEIPSHEDLKIIYEQGGCDGCLDDSVVSMIAYWEMVGFDWRKTRQLTLDWLADSGTWGRGTFQESSPEQLVDSKKHIHEKGYGWKNAASQASSTIQANL